MMMSLDTMIMYEHYCSTTDMAVWSKFVSNTAISKEEGFFYDKTLQDFPYTVTHGQNTLI